MTYVALLWMSPYDETEVKCFSVLAKALDWAADARESTDDSGGQIRVWAWDGHRQYEINPKGWIQARDGRYAFAADWLKRRSK